MTKIPLPLCAVLLLLLTTSLRVWISMDRKR